MRILSPKMKNLPYFKQQTEYTCGPASLKMVLHALGINVSEKQMVKELGTTRKTGTANVAFPTVAEARKLTYLTGRNGTMQDLRGLLRRGYKIIVGYFYEPDEEGHYAVVKEVGWFRIVLADPKEGPSHTHSIRHFKKIWHNDPTFDAEEGWYFAVKK